MQFYSPIAPSVRFLWLILSQLKSPSDYFSYSSWELWLQWCLWESTEGESVSWSFLHFSYLSDAMVGYRFFPFPGRAFSFLKTVFVILFVQLTGSREWIFDFQWRRKTCRGNAQFCEQWSFNLPNVICICFLRNILSLYCIFAWGRGTILHKVKDPGF